MRLGRAAAAVMAVAGCTPPVPQPPPPMPDVRVHVGPKDPRFAIPAHIRAARQQPPVAVTHSPAPPVVAVTVVPSPPTGPVLPAAGPPPPPPLPPGARTVRPPQLRQPLQQLVSAEDYPASARRAGQQGRVAFVLGVGPDGRVHGCTITASSGSSALDSTTCMLMRRRARLTPAMDSNGNPAAGTIAGEIGWSLASPERG